MKTMLMLLLALGLVACSGSKKSKEVMEEEAGIELADNEEFQEDVGLEGETAMDAGMEMVDGAGEQVVESAEQVIETENVSMTDTQGSSSGSYSSYTVQRNETLMMISFKLYGSYDRWKDLLRDNQGVLNGSTVISPGMQLQYMTGQEISWQPNGSPYLIQSGDTLGKISSKTYKTPRYWRNIWDNNKTLIKNPNRIFAGFTIYTPQLRDVATE